MKLTTWSMSAIQDVILRERNVTNVTGVSTELLVLVGYGLVCFLIAVQLLRYGEEARLSKTLSSLVDAADYDLSY